MTVSFHGAARAELTDAVAFYNEQTPGLGDELAFEVQAAVSRIMQHPDSGLSVGPAIRRKLLLRFRYSLLYSADQKRVRILAVMHHSRRPGYWQDRV